MAHGSMRRVTLSSEDQMIQSNPRPSHRGDFEIAIICALRFEFDAVACLLDEIYYGDGYGRALGDCNHYTTGLIGKSNVVLVLLPAMGKVSAASAAASFRSSYNHIKLALIVGICGGVPRASDGEEILLGDVVVSRQVIQYDYGRQFPDGFIRKKDSLNNLSRPNQDIRGFVDTLQTVVHRQRLQDQTMKYLNCLVTEKNPDIYKYPGTYRDKLYEADYRHKHHHPAKCEICDQCLSDLDPVCEQALVFSCAELHCDDAYLVHRERLLSNQKWVQKHAQAKVPLAPPEIHFGTIGSGDTVMKAAGLRDKISREDNIIAFEMEGAGVWENLSCIVIKGVCDYADSHKNKSWQTFAAGAAASAAKALIELYPRTDKGTSLRMSANECMSLPSQMLLLPQTHAL